ADELGNLAHRLSREREHRQYPVARGELLPELEQRCPRERLELGLCLRPPLGAATRPQRREAQRPRGEDDLRGHLGAAPGERRESLHLLHSRLRCACTTSPSPQKCAAAYGSRVPGSRCRHTADADRRPGYRGALRCGGLAVMGYRDRGAACIRCELRRTASERSLPPSSEKHLAVIGHAGHGRSQQLRRRRTTSTHDGCKIGGGYKKRT